jgi:ubiquinone/menaquinone biosynthesis C-methylase UbiE
MSELNEAPAADPVDEVEEMIEPAVPERLRWMAGLVDAHPGERIVDLGCGTGSALAMIAEHLPVDLVGIDSSAAGLRAAARALHGTPGGLPLLVQADLSDPIPLADASVDRAICHNVLEFLRDPDAFVGEVYRVVGPGGRFVLSHSDFDTLVFASEDLRLTRRLVHAYCDTQQGWMDSVDGTIGRRLVQIVKRSPLRVEDVQARVNLSLRFRPGELGYGYAHNLARALRAGGQADPAELDGWLAGLHRQDEVDGFLFSINDYAVVCARP